MKRARGRKDSRPRVVVLGGAGAMGQIIARDLATTGRGAFEVVIADREVAAARGLGVALARADVTDPRSLARVLRGAAAVIASLPYRFNLEAMRGALAAPCAYVDLGGLFHATRRQLALAKAFRERGQVAILGMGSSPGITNILAVLAAEGMERVDAVHLEVGNVDRSRYRSAPPLAFPYSPDTVLDEFELASAVYRDGKLRMVPPLDPRERVTDRFPAPLGELELDTTLHSELATLPAFFRRRRAREITFRQSFDPAFRQKLALLVQLGFAATANKSGASPAPRAVLLELLGRLPKAELAGQPERHEVLRARVLGTRAGRRVTVTVDCTVGPTAGDGVGPDIDTGAPPSIAVQLLLAGKIAPRPGVWSPEQAVPPAVFLPELEKRGMRVRTKARSAGEVA